MDELSEGYLEWAMEYQLMSSPVDFHVCLNLLENIYEQTGLYQEDIIFIFQKYFLTFTMQRIQHSNKMSIFFLLYGIYEDMKIVQVWNLK